MLVATATATDSDGGVGTDSAQIVVIIDQTGATVAINAERRSPISIGETSGHDARVGGRPTR